MQMEEIGKVKWEVLSLYPATVRRAEELSRSPRPCPCSTCSCERLLGSVPVVPHLRVHC